VNESVGVRQSVIAKEFLVERHGRDDFVVMHLVEGHSYHFRISEDADGRRVLSPACRIHRNGHTKHSADLFEAAARRLAIREAFADGLIAADC
jgi:hypothetical protein